LVLEKKMGREGFLAISDDPVFVFAIAVVVFVTKIDAEVWLRLRAGNFDRNFGAGTILAEKWVHWFQENRFPSGDHL